MLAPSKPDQILETAIKMFLHEGYGKVSVADICTHCSITKPTFYKYMESKENLVVSCFERMLKESMETVEILMAQQDWQAAFWQGILASDRASQQLGVEMTAAYVFASIKENHQPFRFETQMMETMTLCLEQMQKQDLITRRIEAPELYRLLVYSDQGIGVYWACCGGSFDLPSHARILMEDLLEIQWLSPAASLQPELGKSTLI